MNIRLTALWIALFFWGFSTLAIAKEGILEYDPKTGITIRRAIEPPFLKTIENYLKDGVLTLEQIRHDDLKKLAPLKNHIRQLYILNSPYLTDISSLGHLTALENLTIENSPELEDLSALSQLSQLKSLTLRQINVRDIGFIEPLNQLESLIFIQQPKETLNITALSNKPHLRILKFGGALIEDLSPLENDTALEELSLAHSQTKDLKPLAQLTQLQRLDLTGVLAKNLKPLETLTELRWVKISHTRFSDYQTLAQFTQLESLIAGNSKLNRLTMIEQMPKLTTLKLLNDPVRDLTPLKQATQLETLELRYMRVNLAPLATVSSLKHLSLEKTRVSNPEVLTQLTALETLDLRDVVGFREISVLQVLPELKTIHVRRGDYPPNQTSLFGKRVIYH